jgi:hypothetical protein
MVTVSQLRRGVKKLRGVIRRVKDAYVDLYFFKHAAKAKEVHFKFNVESEESDNSYLVEVVFAQAVTAKQRVKGYKKVSFNDKDVWVKPFNEKTSPVMVRCPCTDYRFTWFYYNKKSGAHTGKDFPAYKRQTSTYPERNPYHVPGACKHILGAFAVLTKAGLIYKS